MKTTKDEILTVLEELKAEFVSKGIVRLGLFGSFANAQAGVYSDVDIAIAKEPDFLQKFGAYAYFETLNELRETLAKRLHRPVDIFDLDSQSSMKKRVEKEMIDV